MKKTLFTLITSLFLASCQSPPVSKVQKPLVWVSIAPYQELVQRLVGSDIDVEAIIPPNVNPHSFEPTSRQAAHMHQGSVWFQIGEPFEKKLFSLLQAKNPRLISLDLRKCVSLIEEEGLSCSSCSMDHHDRHIWMSPRDTKIQMAEIAKVLQEAFPEKREEITSNLASLEKDLNELDVKIHTLLDSSLQKTILVSHPAFGYFCRDYECKQLSVEYEGKDPRPKHIENILRQALANHTHIAIVLPQYNNKGAQLLAEKLHIPVHMIDPYSSKYFETLLDLAKTISHTPDRQ